ncbi:MAG TPA: carboxypeptidase-like regulatory domain-containing protein, partial [Mucilaginibacter sp.]|nr:carboxypeptidase-like regulatory domain-containing protein [Mucilaginibacter sp.]
MSTFAQTRQVTGKVTGADDGAPIAGVNVRVKGSTTGVATDINGVYKISVQNGSVLTFSIIGYVTQEVTIGSDNAYNLKLATDARSLVEVNVVAIGYGTSKRKDLTGSISSVSAATIAKVPVTTLDQALQGRAAGVQVTNNDASPGGNVTVLIRGTGSLASNGNTPLYVVDGYPVSGGINNIN